MIPIPELHSYSGESKSIVSRQTVHLKEKRMLNEIVAVLIVASLAIRVVEKVVDIYIKLKNLKKWP